MGVKKRVSKGKAARSEKRCLSPFSGTIYKYGDNINTDEIIPARYLNTSDPVELARHCLEDLDAHFIRRFRPGGILIAGRNFGCGSSREHAPIALKACGVRAVVAQSFARIFFRNAINIGLPIAESVDAAIHAKEGDIFRIDFIKGIIENCTRQQQYPITPFPPFMREIIHAGGLLPYIKKKKIRNSNIEILNVRQGQGSGVKE